MAFRVLQKYEEYCLSLYVNRALCWCSLIVFSCLALCKLVECALVSQDQRLNNIQVQGDLVTSPSTNQSTGMRTRARAAQEPAEQWTSIPLLVKIYKLLINELSNCIEQRLAECGEEDDTLDDDEGEGGEDGWEDVEEGGMGGEGVVSQHAATDVLLSELFITLDDLALKLSISLIHINKSK